MSWRRAAVLVELARLRLEHQPTYLPELAGGALSARPAFICNGGWAMERAEAAAGSGKEGAVRKLTRSMQTPQRAVKMDAMRSLRSMATDGCIKIAGSVYFTLYQLVSFDFVDAMSDILMAQMLRGWPEPREAGCLPG